MFANRKGFGICIYFYRELVRSRAETAGKGRAVDDRAVQENLAILGLGFISFDLQHADKAGELWQITSPFGLSLGDRACLATGLIENMPVMTADQVWQKLSLPLDVRLIR